MPNPTFKRTAAFEVEIDGEDLVIRNAKVTAFGYNDPADNGETASGIKNSATLMGCALPVVMTQKATAGSPLAYIPRIPWKTPVTFTDETTGKSVETLLVDNGPDVSASQPMPVICA